MNTELRRRIDDLPLQKVQAKAGLRKFLEDSPKTGVVELTDSMKAAVLFDMACIKFGRKNLWIAAHLKGKGYRVSESLVSRWRNPQVDDLPHFGHLVALGEPFLRLLKKVQDEHFGWGRKALIDLVNAVGTMAEAMEA